GHYDVTKAETVEVEEYERRLGALSEDLRQIALWKLEGYTNVEIAAQLGCTVRTVERKIALRADLRARQRAGQGRPARAGGHDLHPGPQAVDRRVVLAAVRADRDGEDQDGGQGGDEAGGRQVARPRRRPVPVVLPATGVGRAQGLSAPPR